MNKLSEEMYPEEEETVYIPYKPEFGIYYRFSFILTFLLLTAILILIFGYLKKK